MDSSKYQPAGGDKRRGEKRVILDRASVREALTSPDSIDGSNPLFSGFIAGVQAIVFGLLLVVVPVLTTAVISTTLVDQDFHFGATLAAGIKLWVLSSGGDVLFGDQRVSLVPLGITVLLYVLAAVSARRTLQATLPAAGVYVVTFTVVVVLAAAVFGDSVGGVVRAACLSVVLALLAAYSVFRKRPDAGGALEQLRLLMAGSPGWLRPVMGGAVVMLASAFVFACLVVLLWLVLGRESMASILAQWSLDGFSGLALGVAQLMLLPNLVVWAAAWLIGAGFVVGTGSIISPQQVVLGPLPSLPLLGALPQSAAPLWFSYLFAALIVACGVLGGVYLARADVQPRWWTFLVTPVFAAVVTTAGFALTFWLSSGEVGGGPNLVFGVAGAGAALWGLLWLASGALLGFFVTRAEPRDFVRGKFGSDGVVYADSQIGDESES